MLAVRRHVRRALPRLAGWLLIALPVLGFAADADRTGAECRSAGYLCIRIHNATAKDFDRFDVRFKGQTEQYGVLRAGKTSAYRRVAQAFRYAYTEALAGDRWFILQPIDFVGERPLSAGLYTYHYSVDDELLKREWVGDKFVGGYMGITLEADSASSE